MRIARFRRFIAAAGIFARTFRSYRTFNFLSRRIEGYQLDSRPERRAAQTSQTTTSKMPEPIKLAGLSSRVLQWLVLSRDSLQGSRGLTSTLPEQPHLTQRTASHFPLRAGHTPTGKLHCLSCNFSRVAQATPYCNPVFIRLQLFENTSGPELEQAERACGKPPNLWESSIEK
jgi:hypothetical protein